MGQLTKPDTQHRAALTCRNCETDYWTDETQLNNCPNCGHRDFEIHGPSGHDDGGEA